MSHNEPEVDIKEVVKTMTSMNIEIRALRAIIDNLSKEDFLKRFYSYDHYELVLQAFYRSRKAANWVIKKANKKQSFGDYINKSVQVIVENIKSKPINKITFKYLENLWLNELTKIDSNIFYEKTTDAYEELENKHDEVIVWNEDLNEDFRQKFNEKAIGHNSTNPFKNTEEDDIDDFLERQNENEQDSDLEDYYNDPEKE